MALFRVDFSGRGELAERQQKLAQMLSRLQKISEGPMDLRDTAHISRISYKAQSHGGFKRYKKGLTFLLEYNVAVFVTNQMTADPGAGMT